MKGFSVCAALGFGVLRFWVLGMLSYFGFRIFRI